MLHDTIVKRRHANVSMWDLHLNKLLKGLMSMTLALVCGVKL